MSGGVWNFLNELLIMRRMFHVMLLRAQTGQSGHPPPLDNRVRPLHLSHNNNISSVSDTF